MAVFLVNTCKFGRCGATFPTLKELIQHIEETHIDFDPNIIEKYELQQPSSLPLSYVLRVSCESSKKIGDGLKKLIRSISPALSICSTGNTPTGSEMEDDYFSDSDESYDSWSSKEELNSDYILRMLSAATTKECKPFACPVAGCKKRYKNISGIKYHAKNGHCKVNKFSKLYKCHCGKRYKTSQGLKMHSNNVHRTQGIMGKPSKSGIDFIPNLSSEGTFVQKFSDSCKPVFIQKQPSDGLVTKASSLGAVIATLTSSINKAKDEEKTPFSVSLGTDLSSLQLFPNESISSVTEHKATNQTQNVGTKPPPLSPILQQHLLSPVLPKKNTIATVIY